MIERLLTVQLEDYRVQCQILKALNPDAAPKDFTDFSTTYLEDLGAILRYEHQMRKERAANGTTGNRLLR